MNHIQSALKISLAQYSDKGVKAENQDTIGARIPEGSLLSTKGIAVAIADGVSSSSAARLASQSAVSGFLTDYYATPDTWRTSNAASRVIRSLNQYLWGQSRNSVREEGYLTTFSCMVLKGDTCFIFHVGDTRVYRLRDGNLEQLTRDHTQKIDKKTTYLSRALGADPVLEIDAHNEELNVGDVFLLSSDGVHESLTHPRLTEIAVQANSVVRTDGHNSELDELCHSVVGEALSNGSADNLSLQIVRIEELGLSSQDDAVAVLSQLPFPPLLDVGNKIDGLAIEKRMHESERSQVYQVRDESGRSLVMKTPSSNYSDDAAYIERFVLESWVGTRIQSPQVVRVVQTEKERGFLYYLTEHVPGPTLSQLIHERAPMSIPDSVELIEQVCKGLRAFHRKDTLHQDIKPENIVIGSQGAVIIDFGSCWVAGLEEAGQSIERDSILGTLRYSAPEYRYGGVIGVKSDQFSLGVILYEMLTGHVPYGDGYEKAMSLKAFQRLSYVPARKYNPLVPVWLDKSLEKSLSVYPSNRYLALSEFVNDLKRPNLVWLNESDAPLIDKNPVLVWQVIAAIGWAAAIFCLTLILN